MALVPQRRSKDAGISDMLVSPQVSAGIFAALALTWFGPLWNVAGGQEPSPLNPSAGELAKSLQIWLRAGM
jgi:hypothetical protein